ncbi:hypothetical protein RHMOL_Rhmol04G0309300 [Rhododendron molle]|uniref:Uncharacterized protein n=1 Tax=Rhododendron molle TaxID=49168 RepID=A0ACC0P6G0_RHOML|nr:hypothetical protein RHMOL_Rhmol04G0309300 [Rhododendron molle]
MEVMQEQENPSALELGRNRKLMASHEMKERTLGHALGRNDAQTKPGGGLGSNAMGRGRPKLTLDAVVRKDLSIVGLIQTLQLVASVNIDVAAKGQLYVSYVNMQDGMVDHAVNFLLEMDSKGIPANVVTYTSLIDGLCKHGKWKEATGMLIQMVDRSNSPDVRTVTVLVDALSKQGMTKVAEELLKDMIARGVYPNVVTYSALMDGYSLQGRMDEAMRLLSAMGLVQIGRYTAAQESLNEMQAAPQIPNPKTCGLLLDGLCQSGHIDEAMFLFHIMEKRGLRLDIVKYNVLVAAYCNNKTLDNARDVFTVLPSKGYCSDDRTSLT